MQTKKVGTLTLGITLMAAGLAYAVNTLFGEVLPFEKIAAFWPVILIMLGCETLYCYFKGKDGNLSYDGAGIFILIIMTIFALSLGALQFIYTHSTALL